MDDESDECSKSALRSLLDADGGTETFSYSVLAGILAESALISAFDGDRCEVENGGKRLYLCLMNI